MAARSSARYLSDSFFSKVGNNHFKRADQTILTFQRHNNIVSDAASLALFFRHSDGFSDVLVQTGIFFFEVSADEFE